MAAISPETAPCRPDQDDQTDWNRSLAVHRKMRAGLCGWTAAAPAARPTGGQNDPRKTGSESSA
jgi:hypothetical protein